jgi:hypothetical protein
MGMGILQGTSKSGTSKGYVSPSEGFMSECGSRSDSDAFVSRNKHLSREDALEAYNKMQDEAFQEKIKSGGHVRVKSNLSSEKLDAIDNEIFRQSDDHDADLEMKLQAQRK